MKPTIAISVGDLNGVGIEIALKSHDEVKKLCNPLYCINAEMLSVAAKLLNNNIPNDFNIHKVDGKFVKIAEDQGTHAWFTGPRRQQPSKLQNEWQLEVTAQGHDRKSLATMILRWRNAKMLKVAEDIGPNDVVCALVTNVDRQKTLAGAVGIIGTDEYLDIPLGDIQNEMAITNADGGAVCDWLFEGAS